MIHPLLKNRSSFFISLLLFFLLILLLLPLLFFIVHVLLSKRSIFLNDLLNVIQRPYYLKIFWMTLQQALLSACFSVIVALPLAYFSVFYYFPLKKLIISIIQLPFFLPPILIILGFVIAWGNQGFFSKIIASLLQNNHFHLNFLYSLRAVIAAHLYYNLPLAFLFLYTAFSMLPRQKLKAAASLGASPFYIFQKIVLPYLLPALFSAFLLIFLFCFNSFIIVLALGGGKFWTLEVELYRYLKLFLNYSKALAIIIPLLLFNFSIIILFRFFPGTFFLFQKDSPQSQSNSKNLSKKDIPGILLFIYSLLVLLFILIPLLSIIHSAFIISTAGEIKLSMLNLISFFLKGDFLKMLFSLFQTIMISFPSLAIAFSSAFFLARFFQNRDKKNKNLMESLFYLPIGISPVVLAASYIYLLGFTGRNPIIQLFFLILARAALVFPYLLKLFTTAFQGKEKQILLAARSLGASPLYCFFKIEIPLLKNSLVAALFFASALLFGELTLLLILAPSSLSTLPLFIYRLMSSYQHQSASISASFFFLIYLTFFILIQIKSKEQYYAK